MILKPLQIRLSILLLVGSITSMQAQTDTISVFFELDEASGFDSKIIDEQISVFVLLDGIAVYGYADELGSIDHNRALSQRRADAVADYLVMQGMNRRKLGAVEGKGELPPDESSKHKGSPKHRRVDIVIPSTEKPAPPPPPRTPKPEVPPTPIREQASSFEVDTVTKANIVLEGLSFIGGRHFPTPESMPELYKLVETMKKYPQMEIEIQGHICCEYEEFDGLDMDTQEKTLSKNRAQYVYKFLIQEGISAARLSFVGKGSSEPKVFPEKNEDDRQANRRVEIKITKFP